MPSASKVLRHLEAHWLGWPFLRDAASSDLRHLSTRRLRQTYFDPAG